MLPPLVNCLQYLPHPIHISTLARGSGSGTNRYSKQPLGKRTKELLQQVFATMLHKSAPFSVPSSYRHPEVDGISEHMLSWRTLAEA